MRDLAWSDRRMNKLVFIVVCIVIIVLLSDTSIAQIYRIMRGNFYSTENFREATSLDVAIFTLLAIVYAVGQYVILNFVKNKSRLVKNHKSFHHGRMTKAISVLQYVVVALLSLLVAQMVLTSSYSVLLLISIITANYAVAGIVIAILSARFFLWFRTNRTAIILFYGLATAILSLNTIFTFAHASDLLWNQPVFIRPHLLHVSASATAHPVVAYGFLASSITSFILTWSATVILLRHYSKRIGIASYWVIMTVPLAYFLVQFQPLFLDIFHQYRMSDPVTFGVIYTLVFSLSQPIGGVLFGIAMWTVARNLSTPTVRSYMIISAYGLVLFFVSNQAIVSVNFGYPPYGIIAVSFLGLSSYLVLVGIYSAAVSVAQDIELRGSIKRTALEEMKFLDMIGSAQMEQQIIGKVLSISKENQDKLREKSGLDTSLGDDEMKRYLRDVLKEVKDASRSTE